MKLWLGRHGYAGNFSPDPAKERSRPLEPVGVKQVRAIAARLQQDKEFPAIIFSSTIVRAQQTADLYGQILGAPVMLLDDLGPQMPIYPAIKRFANYPELRRVMIVGHHDNMEPTVEMLGGGKASDLFVTAEVRRYKLDRDAMTMVEKYRKQPSDVGQPNLLGYGSGATNKFE